MAKFMLSGLLVLCTHILFAQPTPDPLIDRFFSVMKEDGYSTAIDTLFATNPWMEMEGEEMENLKMQLELDLAEKSVGKYLGAELITEKRVGNRYVYRSYLLRYERQPVQFEMGFYRPDDRWQAMNFFYGDTFFEELQEAGKLYRLPENY
jgi:hypothetical protein